MSTIEFDTPANRIIAQTQPKNQFMIDTSLSDIAFLRQLAVQGRLTYNQGTGITNDEDIITITPMNGSTLFIYKAIFSGQGNSTLFTLRNDGNDRVRVRLDAVSFPPTEISFMDSLVGDGIKSYTCNLVIIAGATGQASLLGWTENTSRIRDVTN